MPQRFYTLIKSNTDKAKGHSRESIFPVIAFDNIIGNSYSKTMSDYFLQIIKYYKCNRVSEHDGRHKGE
jgi:hypothetical protein